MNEGKAPVYDGTVCDGGVRDERVHDVQRERGGEALAAGSPSRMPPHDLVDGGCRNEQVYASGEMTGQELVQVVFAAEPW